MSFEDEIRGLLNPDNSILLKILANNPGYLPERNGLYIVRVPDAVKTVNILNTTTAPTEWKGKPTVVDREILIKKFNKGDKKTIYIGSAHSKEGNELRKRVSQFIKYGTNYRSKNGNPSGHNGGCYTWQIENWGNLKLYWFITEESKQLERQLINRYINEYGDFPLANRV